MPKPDGGVHNESTVESLSLALVSAQKMDNETLFTNLFIYLAYTIHKVTVPATFIVLWPDLSPKLGKELPSFSDFVAIIFVGWVVVGRKNISPPPLLPPNYLSPRWWCFFCWMVRWRSLSFLIILTA